MEPISIAFNNLYNLTERSDLSLTFISSVNHCDSISESSLYILTFLFFENQSSFYRLRLLGLRLDLLSKNINIFKSPGP